MKRVIFAAVAACFTAGPVAADSPKVDVAVKTFKALSADPAKVRIFCEMSKAMDEAGDKPSPAADAKISDFMKQLGTDFESAWAVAEDLNDNSPDGKAYNSALDELAGKCS